MMSAEEVTFDFLTQDYGLARGASGYHADGTSLTDNGGVIVTLNTVSGNGWRLWSDGMRVYKTQAKMTLSAGNRNITAVRFTIVTDKITSINGQAVSGSSFEIQTSGSEVVLDFIMTATSTLSSMVVTLEDEGSGGDAELADPEISWTGESSYSVVLGEAFDAPNLTNPNDLTVTYESSNESVATIDSDGTVAIVGAGQTTISAEFAGDETYNASTVSYELNVITLGAIKANGSEATDLTVYANSEVVFSAENAESISYTVNGGDVVVASSWTPTEVGSYTVVVTATLASKSDTQTFNVTVEEAPATQTVTFVFAELYTVDTVVEETSIEPVTILGDKGSHSNSVPKYYTNGTNFRAYTGNTVTFSVPDTYLITKIESTFSSSSYNGGTMTADSGSFSSDNTVWTADGVGTSTVVFTIGDKQARWTKIVVTYGSETPDTREEATLTFTPAQESYTITYGDPFTEPTLTVNPAEAASEVKYSSDNTGVATVDPTSGEVTLVGAAGTATITAAIKESETYKDVEVSYTLNVTVNVSSLTDFLAAKPETTTVISEPVTVYYQSPDKKYMFITDGTTNMMVYGTLSNTYQNGDVLTGIAGTYTEFGGMDELIPDASTFGEATEGTPIEPKAVTLAEEIAPCDFVILTGVDITGVSGTNATVTDGTNSISAFDRFGLSLAATENATIVAIGAVYNSTKQIYIVSVTETPDTREDVTLTFSETECSAVYGDAFMEPILAVNPETAAEEVKYSSSNTEVATVDGEGKVSILAAGETTITAAIKDSETYKDVEVSYTLTVIELGAIMFNDFVLDEGHMCGAFVGTPVTISAANAEAMSYTIDEGDLVEVEGSSFTWTPEAVGEYSFSVSASLGGQDKTVNFTVTVEEQTIEATLISDVLTLSCFGVSGSTYKEVTYVSEECGLTYTAQMAGGNESIQLRSKNSNSGIVVSANKYGLVAQAATIKWNSNTNSNRALSFYGQQTAFTAPTELYNTEAESLGEKNIDEGAEQTIVFTEDFRYIGLRSKSDAQYVDSIAIIWTLPEPTVYIGEQNAPTIISQLPATLEFATTADEFVKVYYKFEEDGIAAVAAADGYTEVPAEGLTINSFGVLSYYAEVNGWTSNLSTIKFADTTGIVEIEGSEAGEAQWYDLNGRRVAAPGKGIYILKQGNKATKYAF